MSHPTLLILALVLDALLGEPDWLWRRLPHPAVLMGRLVGWCDARFNSGPALHRRRAGVATAAGLFVLALATGVPMDRMMGAGLGFGMLILLGGVLMVTYNPWKAPPRLQPALLVRVLRLKLEKKGG